MNDICAVCQFCTYEDGKPPKAFCHNEQSKNYGIMLSHKDAHKPGCADFSPHIYKDMSLKDALRIVCTETNGATPVYNLPSSTCPPFIYYNFENNKQMADWRDAIIKLFSEFIAMAEKDGDFEDDSTEE